MHTPFVQFIYVSRFGVMDPSNRLPSMPFISFKCVRISSFHVLHSMRTAHICKLDERAHFHLRCTPFCIQYNTDTDTNTNTNTLTYPLYWCTQYGIEVHKIAVELMQSLKTNSFVLSVTLTLPYSLLFASPQRLEFEKFSPLLFGTLFVHTLAMHGCCR